MEPDETFWCRECEAVVGEDHFPCDKQEMGARAEDAWDDREGR